MAALAGEGSLSAVASAVFSAQQLKSAAPKNRSAAQRDERAAWSERLAAYFSIRAPKKTEKDVEDALDHFEPPEGEGYSRMWEEAMKRFGPEPAAEQMEAARRKIHWFSKLKSYYALVESSKTQTEIVALMDRFVMDGRSYEDLWTRVQEKYGVYVDRPHPAVAAAAGPTQRQPFYPSDATGVAERRPSRGESPSSPEAVAPHTSRSGPVVGATTRHGVDYDPAPRARQATDRHVVAAPGTALPLRAGNLVQRNLFVVLVAGVWMKLYRVAGPAAQARFHHAVTAEVADITNLSTDLSVVKVSDHVDGVVVEIDFDVPSGWSAQAIATELIRKVTNGECTVAAIRQAYADHLGGNAQRVYITDAAVLQYFTSPGLRYNVAVSGKSAAAVVDAGGIERDDFNAPASAASTAARAAATAARDTVVYPRGGVDDTPRSTRHRGNSPPRGAYTRDDVVDRRPTYGFSPRTITEPTEASTPVTAGGMLDTRDPIMYDSSGHRIPEWDVIPRQAAPKALLQTDRLGTRTPVRRRSDIPPATMTANRAGIGSVLPEGARPVQPASFMQLYQLGDWNTPGSAAEGIYPDTHVSGGFVAPLSGATSSDRAQEAFRRRGGVG
jgi:hypothetical protein